MLQLLSAPLQDGIRFFQHPLPGVPTAALADAPALMRRNDGFDPSRPVYFRWFSLCTTLAAITFVCSNASLEQPAACRFWLAPVNAIWLPGDNGACLQFTYVGHAISLALEPPDIGDSEDSTSRRASCHEGRSSIVTTASHEAVASLAGIVRLLRTEPQVLLCLLVIFVFI
jgi:hypothetical protein